MRWSHEPPETLTIADFMDMNLVDMGEGRVASFDGFCGTMPTTENRDVKDLQDALKVMNDGSK